MLKNRACFQAMMRAAWPNELAFSCRERCTNFPKNTDLVREAVNCNAVLGEHDCLLTTS